MIAVPRTLASLGLVRVLPGLALATASGGESTWLGEGHDRVELAVWLPGVTGIFYSRRDPARPGRWEIVRTEPPRPPWCRPDWGSPPPVVPDAECPACGLPLLASDAGQHCGCCGQYAALGKTTLADPGGVPRLVLAEEFLAGEHFRWDGWGLAPGRAEERRRSVSRAQQAARAMRVGCLRGRP